MMLPEILTPIHTESVEQGEQVTYYENRPMQYTLVAEIFSPVKIESFH